MLNEDREPLGRFCLVIREGWFWLLMAIMVALVVAREIAISVFLHLRLLVQIPAF